MKYLGLKEISVKDLKVAPTNNRIIIPTEKELSLLAVSMASGQIDPIIVNQNYEIISGQLRWLVAQQIGLTKLLAIVCEFENPMEERIISVIQDYVRFPLTDKDKINFITKCREEGYSVKQISEMTGIPEPTLFLWQQLAKVPEPVKEQPTLLEEYEKVQYKKRVETKKLIESAQFKDKPDEVIELAKQVPLRELKNIAKEAKRGLHIDLEHRKEIYKEKTELINLRVPKKLYDALTRIAKRERIDFHKLIIKALKDLVEKYE